jgi:enterochelin esterase-like enzyme
LRYCIYRAQSGTNGNVVYHLHGRNLDEQIWNDDTYWTSMVQAIWQQTKILPPEVVVISYGPTWLLVPKGQKQDSGLLEEFMTKLPQIDKKTGTPNQRLLLGESMGGLNVLIAGLTYPQSFAKIASLCPGVYATSPFASLSEMQATLKRTGADPKIGFGIWLMAKNHLADEAEWKRASPLELIERANGQFPALYLSNGLYDGYGNFEGSQILANKAAERGVSVEWHPLYGGHCAIDASSLARFLAS